MNMNDLSNEDVVRATAMAFAGRLQLYFDQYKDTQKDKTYPVRRRW